MIGRKELLCINGHFIEMQDTLHKMITAVLEEDPHKGSITSFQSIKLKEQTKDLLEAIQNIGNKEVNENE